LEENQFSLVIHSFECGRIRGVLSAKLSQLLPLHESFVNELGNRFPSIRHRITKITDYHLTFAYGKLKFETKEIEELVKEEFHRIFHCLLTKYHNSLEENPIVFQSPQLAYYQDMMKFIPWDGCSYPF
jgi:hypothetical protein